MAHEKRAFVFDPNVLDARLLRFVLSESGHHVHVAHDVGMLLSEVPDTETHAVLLETELPGMPGWEVCKELRGRGYAGPLIFVTRQADLAVKVRAFACGADDYILKPFHVEELVARVDSVARRCFQADRIAAGDVVKVGDAELQVREMKFAADGSPWVSLTPTETRLLECLMRNSGMTVTRDTLIERTWPNDDVADSNRIDVYIGRLRKKIERDPERPEYVRTLRGVGYRFRPPRGDQVVPLRVHQSGSPEAQRRRA
jgi:two-component system response regulator RegX3